MQDEIKVQSAFLIAEQLERVAIDRYAPHQLARGGGPQLALKQVALGATVAQAVDTAAATSKGSIAELLQATQFSARAGTLGGNVFAELSARSNDPLVDIRIVRESGEVARGVQVKVGSTRYVEAAVASGKYEEVVANAEAIESLRIHGREIGAATHLEHDGIACDPLREADSIAIAREKLNAALRGALATPEVSLAVRAVHAGVSAGATSFAMQLATEIVRCLRAGLAFDAGEFFRRSLTPVAKSAARTSLGTAIVLQRFATEAKDAFSGRLIHRIGRSAHVVDAIAGVVVEAAWDLMSVARGELRFEEFLRRLGIHTFSAVGGFLGAAGGIALARGQHPVVVLFAAMLGGLAGAKAGESVGQALLHPASETSPDASIRQSSSLMGNDESLSLAAPSRVS